MKKLVVFLVVLSSVGGGAFWYLRNQNGTHFQFRAARVERGPFLAAINATGTLQAQEAIDVGAQVAGRIDYFGIDPRREAEQELLTRLDLVAQFTHRAGFLLAGMLPHRAIDFGSPVEKETVLAQLDAALYETEVELARAALELARAEILQLTSRVEQTDIDYRRAQDLYKRKAASTADYDTARVNHDVAQANLLSGKAKLDQAEAQLKRAIINLDYTTIRSPVKGVIIDRRVNVGQTVVASLNAPSLFLIATDLRKLQVWASVNEADIGQVHSGQEVRFTVDAFPGEVFLGQVAEDQPRLNATMIQNVVTYTVVVNTDNPDLRLKPYLTANLRFVQKRTEDALLIPNAALRFKPRPEQVLPEFRATLAKLKPRIQGVKESSLRLVWTEEDGLLRPLEVHVGLSDGTMTEVLGGNLREDRLLVTGEDSRQDDSPSNPFAPKMFGGGKKGG